MESNRCPEPANRCPEITSLFPCQMCFEIVQIPFPVLHCPLLILLQTKYFLEILRIEYFNFSTPLMQINSSFAQFYTVNVPTCLASGGSCPHILPMVLESWDIEAQSKFPF